MSKFNLARFEAVDGAYSALLHAGGTTADDFMTTTEPRAWIKASNRLLDACVDAGMSYDNDDHYAWAAEYITSALVSA